MIINNLSSVYELPKLGKQEWYFLCQSELVVDSARFKASFSIHEDSPQFFDNENSSLAEIGALIPWSQKEAEIHQVESSPVQVSKLSLGHDVNTFGDQTRVPSLQDPVFQDSRRVSYFKRACNICHFHFELLWVDLEWKPKFPTSERKLSVFFFVDLEATVIAQQFRHTIADLPGQVKLKLHDSFLAMVKASHRRMPNLDYTCNCKSAPA